MTTQSVYIAGRWKDKANAVRCREQATRRGWDVTSRWIDLDDHDRPDEKIREEALNDLLDIHRADTVILLADGPLSPGRFTEFGFALGRNKRVVVLRSEGDRSVFEFLPQVETYRRLEDMPDDAAIR